MTQSCIEKKAIEKLEALGRAGFVVSIAYGPCGGHGPEYSVDVMAPGCRMFERPYVARDFAHCLEIAEDQITQRGWRVS